MKKNRAGPVASPARTDGSAQPRDGGRPFPIVGIGASAGGLEAFSALLKHVPLDTGMGFVLVQHLDPEHDSALTQLLGRATSLPVHEVTDNLRVEPNHVYVIPPNTNLEIAAGVLTLHPRPKTRAPHRSIDFFFEALAQDQRERAIGVILSGTATDGTLGLEAIKAEGGITFAQDDSARYDSMPRSAVAAGCVDFVQSPEDIAAELARIAAHPAVAGAASTARQDDGTPVPWRGRRPPGTGPARVRGGVVRVPEETLDARADEDLKRILLLLRNHSGVDFSLYKSGTVRRRIIRRMVLTKHDTLEHYAQFLRGNGKELDALYSDVLISVTSFFRNPEAFEVLQRNVWPALLRQDSDDPIRVWTLGCSTGQEAYSIAMSFVEAADQASGMRKLQVFATDLNDALLDKARHGLYAKTVAEELSPERLRRFFVEEEGGYRVSKALREMVVFARQNVMSDPPFSRMDIISCRNLLIYFEPGVQKRVFPVFHYALKPGGFLCLGASESASGFAELFEPVDKKHKIYIKKGVTTPAVHLPARMARGESPMPSRSVQGRLHSHAEPRGEGEGVGTELSAQREADRIAVNQFAPPAVLINADQQILQFRGPTGPYLEPPTGKASFDVLKMARRGLMLPLRSAINKAKRDNQPARKEHVAIEQGNQVRMITLEVIPLKNLRERCFLVVFQDDKTEPSAAPGTGRRGGRRSARASRAARSEESRRIAALEAELAETRDYVQAVREEHDATNEELQASNEEVQSANEELQSINEELETSKEELESANEELTTVNEEMATRNAELNRLNNDLTNVQTSAHLAIVLLGRDLKVRRFSVLAEKHFNLLVSDVGRPIGHVRHNLELPDLEPLITGVIASVRPHEREVKDKDGRWFSLRVRPYLRADNTVDGAVLVLVDIDDLKRSELAIAAAREYAESIIAAMREPLLVLDRDLRVESVNRAFYHTFGASPGETIGKFIYELGDRQWDIPRLRALLEEILPQNNTIQDFPVEANFDRLGRRVMVLNARRMHSGAESEGRIVLAIEDITERTRSEEKLRASEQRFTRFMQHLPGLAWIKDADGRYVYMNDRAERAFRRPRTELYGKSDQEIFPPETAARFAASDRQALETESTIQAIEALEHGDGILHQSVVSRFSIPGSDADAALVGGVAIDVTELREAEKAQATLAAIVASSDDAIVSKDTNGVITSWNRGAERLFGYTAREAVGQPITFLVPPERLDEERDALERIRRGEVVERFETVRRRKDGTLFDASITESPIRDGQGTVVGASKIVRDITLRRQAEEALRESDRRKTEFLAMLAHELRNPLAPILISIGFLRRARSGGGSDPDGSQWGVDQTLSSTHDDVGAVDQALAVLQRQVGQMIRLIDDLLDAGRINRGKLELRKERVELSSVLYHVVEAVRPISRHLDQALTVEVPDRPLFVDADPTRLAQIVGNLLHNAFKFTDRGGHIWLTVAREADPTPDDTGSGSAQPGRHVVIRVRDTGIGIAADQLERVFEMFAQVDTSLERSLPGLGIGLTLVKRLAEMHGGTAEARSGGLGHGSEFVVRLPIAVDEETRATRFSAIVPEPITPLRILIVDDNRDLADMLSMSLRFSGHETFTVHDGLAAVNAAASLHPDVILMDIGLPMLNGYEAARKIREEIHERRPFLVALTGYGQDEDRRRSQDAGFDAHLVKPVDDVELGKLLGQLGAGSRTAVD